eukprot:TRINITY_DN872_c0_g1_i2.p1 TRINITY_DN872_c0_g1~~TRINITY_DN872_c0_g1_i2.p1  ORF type:complete len:867 (+),score=235.21 TRINITY_DN872_c0_g1_i2:71-2602(+)
MAHTLADSKSAHKQPPKGAATDPVAVKIQTVRDWTGWKDESSIRDVLAKHNNNVEAAVDNILAGNETEWQEAGAKKEKEVPKPKDRTKDRRASRGPKPPGAGGANGHMSGERRGSAGPGGPRGPPRGASGPRPPFQAAGSPLAPMAGSGPVTPAVPSTVVGAPSMPAGTSAPAPISAPVVPTPAPVSAPGSSWATRVQGKQPAVQQQQPPRPAAPSTTTPHQVSSPSSISSVTQQTRGLSLGGAFAPASSSVPTASSGPSQAPSAPVASATGAAPLPQPITPKAWSTVAGGNKQHMVAKPAATPIAHTTSPSQPAPQSAKPATSHTAFPTSPAAILPTPSPVASSIAPTPVSVTSVSSPTPITTIPVVIPPPIQLQTQPIASTASVQQTQTQPVQAPVSIPAKSAQPRKPVQAAPIVSLPGQTGNVDSSVQFGFGGVARTVAQPASVAAASPAVSAPIAASTTPAAVPATTTATSHAAPAATPASTATAAAAPATGTVQPGMYGQPGVDQHGQPTHMPDASELHQMAGHYPYHMPGYVLPMMGHFEDGRMGQPPMPFYDPAAYQAGYRTGSPVGEQAKFGTRNGTAGQTSAAATTQPSSQSPPLTQTPPAAYAPGAVPGAPAGYPYHMGYPYGYFPQTTGYPAFYNTAAYPKPAYGFPNGQSGYARPSPTGQPATYEDLAAQAQAAQAQAQAQSQDFSKAYGAMPQQTTQGSQQAQYSFFQDSGVSGKSSQSAPQMGTSPPTGGKHHSYGGHHYAHHSGQTSGSDMGSGYKSQPASGYQGSGSRSDYTMPGQFGGQQAYQSAFQQPGYPQYYQQAGQTQQQPQQQQSTSQQSGFTQYRSGNLS